MALITLRSPVLVAKQAAEVDLLSRGRLRLAVSVGWNREEQMALGVDPATRGRRIEEAVPLLRRLWTEDCVSHTGESFTLDQVGIHPRPSRPIPIWMGGGGVDNLGQPPEPTMQRAARLADGFKLMAPTGADVDRAIATAEHLHEPPASRDARSTSKPDCSRSSRRPRSGPQSPVGPANRASSRTSASATASSPAPSTTRSRSSQMPRGSYDRSCKAMPELVHRAHHVGSLLRPEALRGAWRHHSEGTVSDEALRTAQDDAIRDVGGTLGPPARDRRRRWSKASRRGAETSRSGRSSA